MVELEPSAERAARNFQNPEAEVAKHFCCNESGMVFFGDADGLDVCRHVDEDVSEKYTRISKGEYAKDF